MKVRQVLTHQAQISSNHLLQVYVSAIAGHIPLEITQAISSFLDICYIAHRASLDCVALAAFNTALFFF